jgi:dUTP pyrophosphatase
MAGSVDSSVDVFLFFFNYCFTCSRVAPRSSLAWKHHIDTGAGVIDADYRGNVGVVLFNHAESPFVGPSPTCAHFHC